MNSMLDAYLRRIAYTGERAPTLDTLRALQLAHTRAIAFENLTPLAGETVDLSPAALAAKLVHGRRGGYCYELNSAFRDLLVALGFKVVALEARVRWNMPAELVTPRNHVLLHVALDEGDYLVDVGFGGLTPTAPLRLEPGIEQPTPHETYRLRPHGAGRMLEVHLGEDWRAVYEFDLQEQQAVDFELGNWYVSRHPQSRFVNQLIVARPAADGRHALLDNLYTRRSGTGETERLTLDSVAALRAVLAERFGIEAPASAVLDARLAELIARRQAAA